MPRRPKVVVDRSWMKNAACRGMAPADGTRDEHIFFPVRGDTDSIALAKLICSTCVVRAQCAQYILWYDQRTGVEGKPNRPNGVFAGMSGRDRWRLLNELRLRKLERQRVG
jgi:hypothetical protein